MSLIPRVYLIFYPNINLDLDMQNKKDPLAEYKVNWRISETHGEAQQIGKIDHDAVWICQCCNGYVEKSQVPICQNTKELRFLGFGFPLFYMFIRNCLLLLLLMIVSYSMISLAISINTIQQFCQQKASGENKKGQFSIYRHSQRTHFEIQELASTHRPNLQNSNVQTVKKQKSEEEESDTLMLQQCTNKWIMLARTDHKVTNVEVILRIASFIIHMFGLLYIKDTMIKTMEYYDQMETGLPDYTVFIKQLPKVDQTRKKLETFIHSMGSDYDVKSIILIPEFEEIEQLRTQKQTLLKSFLKHYNQGEKEKSEAKRQKAKQEAAKEKHQLQELDKKLEHEIHEIVVKLQHDKSQSKYALIIFEYEEMRERFMEEFPQYLEEFKAIFNDPCEYTFVEDAPYPKQIIWKHLQLRKTQIYRDIKGWAFSIAFLLITFIIFYFIQTAKTEYLIESIEKQHENMHHHVKGLATGSLKTKAIIISYCTMIGIVFFNKFIMGQVLHIFVHHEEHDSVANEQFSFAFKYTIGMFFTTALMTIAIQAIKYHNYYTHDFGVIQEESIMFAICCVLIPLIWLIHPWQLLRVIKRQLTYNDPTITQQEADMLMQDYPYDMGKRYAQIIEMMWFTFLYLDLIPLGTFLIFIGLGLYYWVDKFNLLRRSSLNGNVSAHLTLKVLKLLDFTLFLRFFGEIIFDHQIRDGVKPLSIICLIFSLVFMFLPWKTIIEFIFSQEFQLNDRPYSKVKQKFMSNYYTQHPIYSAIIKNKYGNITKKQRRIEQLIEEGQYIKAFHLSNNPQNIIDPAKLLAEILFRSKEEQPKSSKRLSTHQTKDSAGSAGESNM